MSITIKHDTPEFSNVLDNSMSFETALKVLPTKGNLVYEYNPFHNYRVDQTMYMYKDRLFTPMELLRELGIEGIESDEDALEYLDGRKEWGDLVPDSETDPTLIEEGELADFETDELEFDLEHPVNVLPQYSYDNSVNLILNDGKNIPRLINSRFSATERNKYQIVDRKGNNDTNIYDRGSQFDIDTSMYKRVVEIPRLRFIGTAMAGCMPVGNYHFYFRYTDADGNETDFVAESGLVSLFIGSDPGSTRTGFRDEDSHKSVEFILTNIDSAYQYVQVYYTRSTADIMENAVVEAVMIDQKFLVNNELNCDIFISGYEERHQVTVEDINPFYQIVSSAETQAECQNRLFLGNVVKPEIPYKDLEDISLRFLPYYQRKGYELDIDQDYNISSTSHGYYDPSYIYKYVGYWNHEIYRFGVVYIMPDNTLSPVFNVRGASEIPGDIEGLANYTDVAFWVSSGDKMQRNYITVEEESYTIVNSGDDAGDGQDSAIQYENSKGVVSINDTAATTHQVYSINFQVQEEALRYLNEELNIKGLFFVRQKRIPTILCQAYTIGIDNVSHTPVLPVEGGTFVAERFFDDERLFTHEFEDRLYEFKSSSKVRKQAAICPEYDVDYPYYNTLFSGDTFDVYESDIQPTNQYLTRNGRHFYVPMNDQSAGDRVHYNARILGVEDDVKLVCIGEDLFSARAGEAEEGFRYEYLENENKITDATNIVRGTYGPYLAMTGYGNSGKLLDIRIPGYGKTTTEDLFRIRYNDKYPFYAVSERMDLKTVFEDWFEANGNTASYADGIGDRCYTLQSNLYRGDCYICQFTHRLNRNFQDPSMPTNDKIVDPKGWQDNYEVNDGVVDTEKFEEGINLGDINAVKLGMWVTFTVRSSYNLNVRSIDESNINERVMAGTGRGFFPYMSMSPEGSRKIPEAMCINKGFQKALSERHNFEEPDVPAIKNDFTNRIAYSDIHVNDAFKNGFRVFQGMSYRDYPKKCGAVIKLVEVNGSLLCVQEHGLSLIAVNERTVAGKGAGGDVYINTSNVLPENPNVISDSFGSQWRDSVIKTASGVYGVDTVGRKIWRFDGQSLKFISDFKVQEFLNDNISLTERELYPMIGVRNVKTHYNKYKHDVMFTFYDNLYGFEERVWNLCYNEQLQTWTTFYSWVPSYSENIWNQYFSFDRNTSKWITKLGVSHAGNDFSDGVCLSENIIPNDAVAGTIDEENGAYGYAVGTLSLENRELQGGDNITITVEYTLERDDWGNYRKFAIHGDTLYMTCDAVDLCSEMFQRTYSYQSGDAVIVVTIDDLSDAEQYETWKQMSVLDSACKVLKDDRGRRLNLAEAWNKENIVTLLNIRANVTIDYETEDETVKSLAEAYAEGVTNNVTVDAGYYESVVAVMPKYNMQFLTTDFWRHGKAGIIDIADKVYPAYWYGKQHPFEFEFIVSVKPESHKIFDNLEIIGNNAEPESFHYEIVGDCYDFAKDKKNMYIRQEATKRLYQYNGVDIVYDHDYEDLHEEQRKASDDTDINDKSTLLPLYYSRQDTINEIEDYYHLKDGSAAYKNFSALSGGEIVWYKTLDEYRIWSHAKAVTLQEGGRMRGNMQYKEDKWDVQINPLNIVQRNEKNWPGGKIPIELGQSPLPDVILEEGYVDVPEGMDNEITKWDWQDNDMREAKLKDKWLKVRIRYTGDRLAVIAAVRTLYSISYA